MRMQPIALSMEFNRVGYSDQPGSQADRSGLCVHTRVDEGQTGTRKLPGNRESDLGFGVSRALRGCCQPLAVSCRPSAVSREPNIGEPPARRPGSRGWHVVAAVSPLRCLQLDRVPKTVSVPDNPRGQACRARTRLFCPLARTHCQLQTGNWKLRASCAPPSAVSRASGRRPRVGNLRSRHRYTAADGRI
jgi:hypothetical protein